MDRLEAMSLLITSVEAGSFSAAVASSRATANTQPQDFGIRDASPHQAANPVDAQINANGCGPAYVAASKRILEQVGEAEAAATGEFAAPRGELVITGPMTFGQIHLLPIVNEFLLSFPEINVRMALSDRNMNLADEHIDAAIQSENCRTAA